tara:strand:- start:194 stop:457 length:264 start_codon:yes stop_codon:yes gene_type:complete
MATDENLFNQSMGQKIKGRRINLGFTQTKVGKAVNVTFQQIQKYEKGKNGVSSFKLNKLSKALQVPITYFFDPLVLTKEMEVKSDQS